MQKCEGILYIKLPKLDLSCKHTHTHTHAGRSEVANRWLIVHTHGCTRGLTHTHAHAHARTHGHTNSSRGEYASLINEMGQAMGGRGGWGAEVSVMIHANIQLEKNRTTDGRTDGPHALPPCTPAHITSIRIPRYKPPGAAALPISHPAFLLIARLALFVSYAALPAHTLSHCFFLPSLTPHPTPPLLHPLLRAVSYSTRGT